MNYNVIPFPRKDPDKPDQTPQQDLITRSSDLIRPTLNQYEMDELINSVAIDVIARFQNAGFDPYKGNTIKEVGMLLESIRSYVYKLTDEPHPFQDFADHFFIEEAPGVLRLRSVATTVEK
jgi:hypothetical protein